jgi:hypothetical protein
LKTLQQIVDINQPHAPEGVKLEVDYLTNSVAVCKGCQRLFSISRRDIDDQPNQSGDFRHLLTEHLEQR